MSWSRANAWEVTVPGRGGRSRPGIIVHRSSTLRPCDVEKVDGIPCTTVARTIFDLSEILKPRPLERVLDEADGLEVLDMIAIDEQIAHNAARKKAVGRLTMVLANHRVGSTRTDGPIGEHFLAVIRRGGLPDPETQFWIDFGDGEPMIRADFAYPDVKVILETDGGWHRTRRRIDSDKRRDQRAARAGWLTLRFTWAQTHHEPWRIIETIAAVRQSRRRPPPGSGSAAA